MSIEINGAGVITGVDSLSTPVVTNAAGSASAPSIAFTGDANTGLYSPGADQVAISTGGTGRLFIDSSGRVGLGTSAPSTYGAQLAVIGGSIHADRNIGGAAAQVQFSMGASSGANFGQIGNTGTRWSLGYGTTANTIGTEVLVWNSSGNVGVGTTSPFALLHVKADTNKNLIVQNGGADTIELSNYNTGDGYREVAFGGSVLKFNTGTAGGGSSLERARIDSSGRLLVGTSTAPSTGGWNQYAKIVNQGNTGGAANGGVLAMNRGTAAASMVADQQLGVISFGDSAGNEFGTIICQADAQPGNNDYPGRLVFSTTADGANSPTERLRITNTGKFGFNEPAPSWNFFFKAVDTTTEILGCQTTTGSSVLYTGLGNIAISAGENAAVAPLYVRKSTSTNRSINAAGTINASGADYAEYMVKAGDFDIAKGAVCGITSDGLLTLNYADAVSFVVKSTNPSYVGGDTWGTEDAVGPKPDADDTEALAQWEADLEAARRQVDRIAFAGQVPVNVMGATPGQYIVPVEAADGGIEGVAKKEADLTLAEYIRAVGKVIAIEDDGRARIIVKVA